MAEGEAPRSDSDPTFYPAASTFADKSLGVVSQRHTPDYMDIRQSDLP